jgi:hypothetical protein
VERALLPAQRIFFAEFGHGVAISSKKQGGVLQRRGYILSKRCNKEVYFDLLNSPEYRAEVFELVWPPLSACVGWRVRRALRALLRHAQEAGSEAGDARVSVVGSLAHLVSSVGCRVTVGVTGGGGGIASVQPLLIHGSDGCISALLPTRVLSVCPRGGRCGPVPPPLLEIEAGPDPSLVPQW